LVLRLDRLGWNLDGLGWNLDGLGWNLDRLSWYLHLHGHGRVSQLPLQDLLFLCNELLPLHLPLRCQLMLILLPLGMHVLKPLLLQGLLVHQLLLLLLS
jgi:hypothetical protein